MALKATRVVLDPLPAKTLIAKGRVFVTVNCSSAGAAGAFALGDGTPLPESWTPGSIPGLVVPVLSSPSSSQFTQPVSVQLNIGDKLYAWPVAGDPVVLHVMESN